MAHENPHAHETEHAGPSPRGYVIIGLILAILTAIEFLVFYIETNPAFMTSVFIILTLAKFVLVVGYFMHLRFDDQRLTAVFVFPLIAMISIVVALLAMFRALTVQ